MYNNPKKSLEFSQDFIQINQTPDDQILFQNSIANANFLQANYSQAVKSYSNIDEIIKGKKSPFYDLFLRYSLAELFQNLGLYKQSQKVISIVLQENEFLDDSKNQFIKSKFYRLKAINNGTLKDYTKAFSDLEQSKSFLKNKSIQSEILKIENEIYRGVLLLNIKNYIEAEIVFNELLKNKTVLQYKYSVITIELQLAKLNFLQQKPEESIKILHSALFKIKDQNFHKLHSKLYKQLAEAYLAHNNIIAYQKYTKLNTTLENKINKDKKLAISNLVTLLEGVNQEELEFTQKEYNEIIYRSALLVLLIVLLLAGIYYFVKKREKELDKQLHFFKNFNGLKNQKLYLTTIKNSQYKPMLSLETEKKLLKKLNQFEESELYLNKQMTISVLAAHLDTNIKYLSEVIKRSKDKKFNAYINDLRIAYIVDKLKNEPVYLNYKVSYLAELTGFSSHSAFTAIFKSVTGMSPNSFIKKINQQKNR